MDLCEVNNWRTNSDEDGTELPELAIDRLVVVAVALFPNEASMIITCIPSPLACIGRIVYGPLYT